MQLSVIIPVYNGERFLPACLAALAAEQARTPALAVEIVAVDNASPDGAAQLIEQRYPHVRLLRNATNLGFAGGCNQGLAAATGDLLVLLNQDATVQPGWLAALVQALAQPEVGMVGCKILYPDGQTLQHAGGYLEWPLALGRHYGYGERDQGQWDTPRAVEFVTGAALALRRSVYAQIGPLDAAFFPSYFEDVDWCLRAQAAGYTVLYAPQAVVQHVESSSEPDRARIARSYEQGRLRLVLKHLSPARFLREFVPAEQERQPTICSGHTTAALQAAYWTGLSAAPAILQRHWPADSALVEPIQRALLGLAQQASRVHQQGALAQAPRVTRQWANLPADPPSFPPLLTEFVFVSNAPLVGPLLSLGRRLWYNIAARWAVRHLQHQQAYINEQYALQIDALQRQIEALAVQNGLLAQALADLQQREKK